MASAHALEEARRNIALKYPSLITDLERLAAELLLVPEAAPEGVNRALQLGLPTNDAPTIILAAAISARADLLVTGDRAHFGPLYGKVFGQTEVASPAEALARVLKSAE